MIELLDTDQVWRRELSYLIPNAIMGGGQARLRIRPVAQGVIDSPAVRLMVAYDDEVSAPNVPCTPLAQPTVQSAPVETRRGEICGAPASRATPPIVDDRQ